MNFVLECRHISWKHFHPFEVCFQSLLGGNSTVWVTLAQRWRRCPSEYSMQRPVCYQVFPSWLVAAQIIPTPVWAPGIILPVPFWWFCPYLWVVSLHALISTYLKAWEKPFADFWNVLSVQLSVCCYTAISSSHFDFPELSTLSSKEIAKMFGFLLLALCPGISSVNKLGSLHCLFFSFLFSATHCPVLPVFQHLKIMVSSILFGFWVVSGRDITLFPLRHPGYEPVSLSLKMFSFSCSVSPKHHLLCLYMCIFLLVYSLFL